MPLRANSSDKGMEKVCSVGGFRFKSQGDKNLPMKKKIYLKTIDIIPFFVIFYLFISFDFNYL